jgi:hypothetical protein
MNKPAIPGMRIRCGILLAVLFLAVAPAAWPQTAPDFTGLWKQDNDRSQPKRSGDVTLRIVHREPEFTVETTISHGSNPPRHAVQRYVTDGKASVSTGADGDEFLTSVVWMGASLVFSIEEHEDGRILRSTETWSLLENGSVLRRIRERPDGDKQVLFYRRELLAHADRSQP